MLCQLGGGRIGTAEGGHLLDSLKSQIAAGEEEDQMRRERQSERERERERKRIREKAQI